MKKILFVCTGNTCRSPMAEIIFSKICSDRGLPYKAKSAGICTVTGLPISGNSESVLKEAGYNPEGFTSTDISDLCIEDFDLFAVMTPDHGVSLVQMGVPSEKVYVLALSKGGISDPYMMSEGVYRLCCDEIEQEICKLVEWLGEKYGD